MKPNFFANHHRIAFTLLAFAASFATSDAMAQVVQLNKVPSTNGPINVPSQLPPQLLPDLKIDYVTGTSGMTYAAKIVNVGAIASAATHVYCAATVSNATHWYTIERVQPLPALNVNASYTVNCDFSTGADHVKPGEKLQSVAFIANNSKTIKESNYANNELRTTVN